MNWLKKAFPAFAVLLGLTYIGCMTKKQDHLSGVEAPKELPYPKRIIDAHAHFDIGGNRNPRIDGLEIHPSKTLLEEFAGAGIIGTVIHLHLGNLSEIMRHPDWPRKKMAMCVAVVPGETVENVRNGITAGNYQCLKVYLGYVPKYPTDPFYTDFYKVADELKVPVVFHTGDTSDDHAHVKYAHPLEIDEVAVTYPNVKFVIAHMGNPWIQSAAEVVYKNDNVYADTSALYLGDLSKASPEAIEELVVKPIHWFYLYIENPKKLMFGSDWSLVHIKPYVQAVQKAIPEEDWDKVFYQNAADSFWSYSSG